MNSLGVTNNDGPRQDPWGTLNFICAVPEEINWELQDCLCPCKHNFNQPNSVLRMPQLDNVPIICHDR